MKHTSPRLLPLVGLLVAPALLAPSARANETNPDDLPWKKAGIFLGGYLATFDSTVRLGSDAAGLGLEANLEDAFGLDSSTQALRLGGFWRFGDSQRHRISVDYYNSKRDASKTLEQDVTIGDTTFPAGTDVSADTSFSIIKATYSYSFLYNESVDLAAAFGIYTMPFKLEFEGLSSSENSDFTAPLPVFGLHLDVALAEEWFLRQRLDLFYLEYGDFRGGLADVYLGVEWYPWEHLGFGLGFESFRIALEAGSDEYPGLDLNGDVKYTQNGLFLYATYAF